MFLDHSNKTTKIYSVKVFFFFFQNWVGKIFSFIYVTVHKITSAHLSYCVANYYYTNGFAHICLTLQKL